MIIGVAGPYSADTEEKRRQNVEKLNKAAVQVLAKGHTPLIGVNAALPVVQQSGLTEHERYEAIMKISMAVIDKCDALLIIAESPGAIRERDMVLSKGLPIYYSIQDVPGG